MNTSVENYFVNGCLRCPLGTTPQCKVNTWSEELVYLRDIATSTLLTEECKWGVPVYTLNGKNVISVSALKEYCCISFFKGALITDTYNILEKPGPRSQAVRLLKFTAVNQIASQEHIIKEYILEAISNEELGKTIEFSTQSEPLPEELLSIFKSDPVLESAFYSLTPGRQRGYIIYFSSPKKAETRISRIQKSSDKIMNGIGLHDKYKSRK